jgi:hypothetical protein
MGKKVFFLGFAMIFLFACGEPPREGCEINTEIKPTVSEGFCIESLKCYTDGVTNISSYTCFCDKICLCFFAVQKDCESIKDVSCEKSNSMMLMDKGFCLEDGKRKVLEDMFELMKE